MANPRLPSIVKKEIDDSHFYFVNGEYYPGVTTILEEAAPVGPELKQYFIKNSQEEIKKKSEESLEIGSSAHEAIAHLLMGEEIDLNEVTLPNGKVVKRSIKEKKSIIGFSNWFTIVKPTNYLTEHTVASVSMKYAGTLDFAGWLPSENITKALTDKSAKNFKAVKEEDFWIIDWKTSAGIYYNYQLQGMAYKKAYEEMYGIHVDHVGIVRVGTNHSNKYEFVEVTPDQAEFVDFENVYKTYLKLHGGKIPQPPTMDVYPSKLKIVASPAENKA